MNKQIFLALLGLSMLLPSISQAQSAPFEYSGWIPYWRIDEGIADATANLNKLKEINPFGLSITNDGALYDGSLHLEESRWQELQAAAKAKKIRYIPTIMWSDGEAMHNILSDPFSRGQLVDQIVANVYEYGWSGIDLDFEGKKAETKDYFSAFLRELYPKMGNKWVMCTIEARTPLERRYDNIPDDIEYANDYVEINKYCDRVRIMTYDQQRADLTANRAGTNPYIPIADPKWVESVVTLAKKNIPARKLVIGVATYGYEWDATPLSSGFSYQKLWAFNPKYATDLALKMGLTTQRNRAGEMSFSYIDFMPTTVAPAEVESNPPNSLSSLSPAQSISTLPWSFRVVWWSDAESIRQKVALAKKLGVRGIAIFKIDGGEDPKIWEVLK